MVVHFDIISIFTFIGIALSLLLIISMLTNNKGNLIANMCLSLVFLILIFSVCNSGIFYYTNLVYRFPHVIMLPMLFLPLVGPLFFIYIKLLVDGKHFLNLKIILHFLPALIYLVYQIPFLSQHGDRKLVYINQFMTNTIDIKSKTETSIVLSLTIIQITIYFILSLRHISEFEAYLKSIYSYEKIDFMWIKRFIFAVLFTFLNVGVFLALMKFLNLSLKTAYRPLPLVVVSFLCYLTYHAMRQSNVMIDSNLRNIIFEENSTILLNKSEIDCIVKKINKAMEVEKYFTEPSLSLPDLASKLGVLRNQLSFVINNQFGETFCDFINRHRVKEAKRQILESKNHSFNLLNIAMNVGFNSKTAFNVNFKKFTNISPSEYKKQYLKTRKSSIQLPENIQSVQNS